MCSDPVTRTPFSGFSAAYFLRIDIRPGISCSAISISLRPQSASDMSATLKSSFTVVFATAFIAWLHERARFRLIEPESPPSLISQSRTCSAPRRVRGDHYNPSLCRDERMDGYIRLTGLFGVAAVAVTWPVVAAAFDVAACHLFGRTAFGIRAVCVEKMHELPSVQLPDLLTERRWRSLRRRRSLHNRVCRDSVRPRIACRKTECILRCRVRAMIADGHLVISSRRFDHRIYLDLRATLVAGPLWLDVIRQACRLIGWIERLQICCLICFYVGSRCIACVPLRSMRT